MTADSRHAPDRSDAPSSVPRDGPRVAVLGATGLVGRLMVRQLEERGFPVGELVLLASRTGARVPFRGREVEVQAASPGALAAADLVLSSAGGSVSRELLPEAARQGTLCIDNTSAFRMDAEVPLVVPEVNGGRLDGLGLGDGALIANPNCSTIQLVLALKPLHDAATLRRVVVSTYQSISGAGRRAVVAFESASQAIARGDSDLDADLQDTVAFDVQPDIGGLDEQGDSIEELKMVNETVKILEADVAVDATCVRVPVLRGHAESVWIETERPLPPEAARDALRGAPGVVVDDGDGGVRFTPRRLAGRPEAFVGRLRRSRVSDHGLQFWVVADNLLKGAALNAVQIAERLLGVDGADGAPVASGRSREPIAGAGTRGTD